MDSKEFLDALNLVAKEKGIDKEVVFEAIEASLVSACKKTSAQARILRWLSTENPAMLPAMRRKPLQALWRIRSWKFLWKWQEC